MTMTTHAFVQKLRKQGVRCGDVVRLRGKPHYIQGVTNQYITLVSMDERKMFITLWGWEMHKNKPSKHKPVLVKKRNPVVAALVANPKRNAGKHKGNQKDSLTMLDTTEKE